MQTSPQTPPAKLEKFLRLKEVESLTGLRKSSIYSGMHAGTFPVCVRLSTRAVAWRERDLVEWQEARRQVGAK